MGFVDADTDQMQCNNSILAHVKLSSFKREEGEFMSTNPFGVCFLGQRHIMILVVRGDGWAFALDQSRPLVVRVLFTVRGIHEEKVTEAKCPELQQAHHAR